MSSHTTGACCGGLFSDETPLPLPRPSPPLVTARRYWSDNTNYAKQNGGEWDFVVEPQNQLSIPVEEAFWEYLMSSSRRWGLDVYEQDWCAAQPSPHPAGCHPCQISRVYRVERSCTDAAV